MKKKAKKTKKQNKWRKTFSYCKRPESGPLFDKINHKTPLPYRGC